MQETQFNGRKLLWQKIRLVVLNRDDFTCQYCYETRSTLHVHHKIYVHGQNPWDYESYELTTLCEECHNLEKQAKEKNKDQLKYLLNIVFSQQSQSGLIKSLVTSDFGYDSGAIIKLMCFIFESPKNQKKVIDLIMKEEK